MIWLGIALLIAWGLASLVFHVASAAIHLLLVAAVIAVVWWAVNRFATNRRSTV